MFLIGVTFLIIMVVGLIGNLMVIFVITMNKQLHESTSVLICNLALADLLFLTFCVPITAYSYIYSWQFSRTVCYITVIFQYVTCYVSVWTLVLLAYDRFSSIMYPSRAAKSISRSVVVLCLSLWICIFVVNFFQVRNVGIISHEFDVNIASGNSTQFEARIFYWGFNLGAYVFPLALSIIYYVLLVQKIWRQKLIKSKSSQKIKRHATKMVFVVILTFGLCWFPQNMRFFLRGLHYPEMALWETRLDDHILLWIQCSIQILAYANSCINPILYGILSERFRAGFQRVWHRIMRCDPCRENNFRISSQGLQSANIRTPVCSSKRPSSASPNLWIFWPRSQRRMTEPATNSKRIEVQCTYNGETKRITNSVVPHQLSSTVLSPINEVPNGTAAHESKSVTLVTKQSNFSSGIEDDGIEDGYSDSDVILL